MSNIDKQALREAAGKVNSGDWSYEEFDRLDLPGGSFVKIDGRDAVYCLNKPVGGIKQSRAVIAFIATFNPKVALALLNELEAAQKLATQQGNIAVELFDEVTRLQRSADDKAPELREQLEAAEKRIAELSKAASVNNHWKPDVCPITGRMFFMWIEHETLGYVPTYGGPFDSYTIPTRDSSGEYSCERYDHDVGGWVEGETIGLYLIDDDEQCRVCELEERMAETNQRNAELTAKIEPMDRRIAELERSETQLINERDSAESALNDAYKAVMGQAPEWSNWFSFGNAIDEIELACEQWRNQTDDVIQFRQRIQELEAKLETADKLQDSAFRDGLKAGFSYGQTDDQSGFTQCMSAYSNAGINVKE